MFEFTFPPLTSEILTGVLVIFVLRVIGMAFSTIRVLVMMRGKKLATAVTGFVEVFVYILAIGGVVNNLSNIWNVLAYSLGFVAPDRQYCDRRLLVAGCPGHVVAGEPVQLHGRD